MKTLIPTDQATIEALAERLKQAKSRPEYQRIQCVLIRATLGSSAAEIAHLLGWSTSTVHVLHSRWAKEGDAIFDMKAKGGRRNQYLALEEEAAFLQPFLAKAKAGGALDVPAIKAAFEARVGGPVATTTIYRLIQRWDGRKLGSRKAPAGAAAEAGSKKTRRRP